MQKNKTILTGLLELGLNEARIQMLEAAKNLLLGLGTKEQLDQAREKARLARLTAEQNRTSSSPENRDN